MFKLFLKGHKTRRKKLRIELFLIHCNLQLTDTKIVSLKYKEVNINGLLLVDTKRNIDVLYRYD